MRATNRVFLQVAGLLTLVAALVAGCASSSWDGVRRKDTVGSYHQFLRDHPSSRHAAEARERLAFLRVKNLPTLEAFEEFESVYPDSSLTAELREIVEPLFFELARETNEPEAYRDFLRRYPNGHMTAKARGNLAYVAQIREAPTPAALRTFVEQHPDSDFVEEAVRTLELVEFRRSTSIRRLGVRVEVAPNVVQADRVRRGFAAVVARNYRDAGIEVAVIPPGEGPSSNMDGWMRIDYHEAPASGTFGGRTLLSHCRVRLYHKDFEEPVWDRKFEAPAEHEIKGAYGRDKTVFGNSKYSFWESFFVPVSTWAVSQSRVKTLSWHEDVRDIHVMGDRAVVLFERGGVDLVDISTPIEPKVTDRFRRGSDLTHWHGVRLIDDRHIMIYGSDGAELLLRTDTGIKRVADWDAAEIGAISGVASYDGRTVFLAGAEGLYAIRLNQKPLMPHRLLDGEVIAVAARHPYVYVVRRDKVEVATPKHLLRHLTGTKLSLGKFRALKVRTLGDSLYLFGKKHIVRVSLEDPQNPRVAALMSSEDIGSVSDVAADQGHLYLLGSRGLQVAGPQGKWIADSIQVNAVTALQINGRFAFLVGGKSLEVLDLAPYRTVAAAPAD